MERRLKRVLSIGLYLALLCSGALADRLVISDDFSGAAKPGETYKQVYPEQPAMAVENGALNVKPGTVWYVPSRKFSIADYPGGLRLVADVKFYPQPGYEWKPSGNFHFLGFQNSEGGVGTVYARFTVDDIDRDGTVDCVIFSTKNSKESHASFMPGTDPAKQASHQFRIDWYPDRMEAYFDGKLVTTDAYSLDEPVWVVGRNEQGGTIIDNLSVSAIGGGAAAPKPAEAVSSYADPVRISATALPAPASARIVDDAQASGGKALELSGDGKKPLTDLITIDLPKAERSGRYVLRVRARADGLYDLGRAWRVQATVGGEVVGWAVLHGYQFKGVNSYADFEIGFDLATAGAKPQVCMFWVMEDASKPVIRLDRLEIARLGDLPAVQITRVWPDRIRYMERQTGTLYVACRNNTAADTQTTVKVELVHDLNASRLLAERQLTLPPNATQNFALPLQPEGGRFGYEVRATALIGGKTVSAASEYFCVTNNPNEVATHHGRFGNWEFDPRNHRNDAPSAESIIGAMIEGRWQGMKHSVLWPIRLWLDLDPSDEDLAECAAEARSTYMTWFEVYSWAEGGLVDMDPKASIWYCGDDSRWLYSKRQIVGQVAAMKRQGIGVCTYIIPFAQGLPGIDLLRERPDWFCTSVETRDLTGYDVAAIKRLRDFRNRLQAAPKSEWPRFQQEAHTLPGMPYIKPNFTKREVVDYAVDRLLDSIKTYDWDGLRWDCGNLETGQMWGIWKPFLDFQGKPLCRTPEEMVEQTIVNLNYFQSRIRQERPNFYFGLNYGGIYPTLYPRLTAAFMQDGGWLLDEETRRWSWHDSAWRNWDKYYEYMSDRGEMMTASGGHYNPYGLHIIVPGAFHAAHMYHMIFGIAGHGHPEFYMRSKVFPIGDTTQFAVRFGKYLFDSDLRRVSEPEKSVQVAAPHELWWKRSVLRKQSQTGETWVIHLVNPPGEKAIEDNTTSALPAPVKDVKVSFRVPAGRRDVRAWALVSESWRSGESPLTQAVPLDIRRDGDMAQVSIPEVLFWKVIVFECN